MWLLGNTIITKDISLYAETKAKFLFKIYRKEIYITYLVQEKDLNPQATPERERKRKGREGKTI